MIKRLVPSFACVALAVGSPARADGPVAPAARARPVSAVDVEVGLVTGPLTPEGTLGAEVQIGATPWFAIAGGGGWELMGSPQFGVMPRARIPFGSYATYAGVGVSWGHFRSPAILICPFGGCEPDADGDAEYVTAEAGIEVHDDHLFARLFLGGKAMLNYDELCPSGACDRYFMYGGLAGGLRFR
jgi:hypothetical protein